MSAASSKKHFNVPWNWRQALVVFFGAWIGLPVMLFFIIQAASKGLSPAKQLLDGLSSGNVGAAFGFLVAASLSALLLVRFYLDKYKASWQDVGFKPFNIAKAGLFIFIAFWLFVFMTAGVFWLLSHVPGFNASQPQTNEFTQGASSQPNLSLLALVILPPFFEETVFRGFIFPALSDRFGVALGIISSSALFAVAHWQLNVSIYTFVLGCILATMYWKLKSIWPGLILHMLNNYLAFTALVGK